MMISRRNFVTGTAATALGLAGGLPAYAQDAKRSGSPLKIPALLEGTLAGDARIFDLTAMAGKSEFLSGVSTPTLGINGAYLGPTIRCRSGERVTLRVKNSLNETTTLHWHGLIVPAKYDGGPHQVVEPGTTWEPSFEIKQNASLCWYHSHAMGRTGEQVLRGLAGLFLIDDDESRALGLPSEEAYVAAYCRRRGLDGIGNWSFFLAFSFFRLAAICQGVYRRALDGNASNPEKARTYGEAVKLLAALAVKLIDTEN